MGYMHATGSDSSRVIQYRGADKGLAGVGPDFGIFGRDRDVPPPQISGRRSLAFRRQRDAIIERSLPLADHIARRYGGRGEPFDDLVQAARVGLVNAVNRFDVDNGADFLAFAVPTMMGEVRRHFRDYGWAIKVPRRVKELQPQLIRGHE